MCRADDNIGYSDDADESIYDRKPKKKRELSFIEQIIENQHRINQFYATISEIKNSQAKKEQEMKEQEMKEQEMKEQEMKDLINKHAESAIRMATSKNVAEQNQASKDLNEYGDKLLQLLTPSSLSADIEERASKMFGMDCPYPLTDVIDKLVFATEYLLYKKDYDGHNYEELNQSVAYAKQYKERIAAYLAGAKDLSAGNGWIDVSERLPEIDVWVFVYYEIQNSDKKSPPHRYTETAKINTITLTGANSKSTEWLDKQYYPCEPTHWMPLPAPPAINH